MAAKAFEIVRVNNYNVSVSALNKSENDSISINVKVIDEKVAQRLDGIFVEYKTKPIKGSFLKKLLR